MSATALQGGWAKVVTIKCDACGEEAQFPGTTNRVESRRYLKLTERWTFKKPNIDLCPKCSKDGE